MPFSKEQQQHLEKLLVARQFSTDQPPPPEQVVFRINLSTIGSLGDYALLTGRPKAGKTKYLSGAMAAAISRAEIFGMQIKLPEGKNRVVHFDTEQGKRSHYNVLTLMQRLAGDNKLVCEFDSFHCRQDPPRNILAMIEYYLQKHPDTGLIVLDGLLDCIESFNDEKASKSLVNWLKRITEANNTFLLGVLHRSMSVDKSIGHLGSTADRAAQSVLIVEKNKETMQYILRDEYLRESDSFPPIAIRYNKQMEIWEQCDYIEEAAPMNPGKVKSLLKRKPKDFDLMEHTTNVVRIFNYTNTHTHLSLMQRIVEVYGTGKEWAKECVAHLEKINLIFRTEEGFTNIRQGKIFAAK